MHEWRDSMLGGALGRFFLDLDKVQNRSPYEEALHKELLELAKRSEPLSLAYKLTTDLVRSAIQSSPALQVEIDSSPGPDDTVRLKCGRADCPNKRI
jgi:hypothetical protein